MKTSTSERERPSEWLRELKERETGYAELLRECGDAALAAYRIAVARCRTRDRSCAIPTVREIRAAACEVIASATDGETPVPSATLIIEECEHAGLLVLRP